MGPLVGQYANRLPTGKQQFTGGELDVPEFCESYLKGLAKPSSLKSC